MTYFIVVGECKMTNSKVFGENCMLWIWNCRQYFSTALSVVQYEWTDRLSFGIICSSYDFWWLLFPYSKQLSVHTSSWYKSFMFDYIKFLLWTLWSRWLVTCWVYITSHELTRLIRGSCTADRMEPSCYQPDDTVYCACFSCRSH